MRDDRNISKALAFLALVLREKDETLMPETSINVPGHGKRETERVERNKIGPEKAIAELLWMKSYESSGPSGICQEF